MTYLLYDHGHCLAEFLAKQNQARTYPRTHMQTHRMFFLAIVKYELPYKACNNSHNDACDL